MEYHIKRTCTNCHHVDLFPVTKIQARFELYDTRQIWTHPCSKCHSTKAHSLTHAHPPIDIELLDLWGNNPDWYFAPQDEDIILAEMDYFEMILKAIDDSAYLKIKIDVLVSSMCVLLYNNTFPCGEFDSFSKSEQEERSADAQIIRPELMKRKQRVYEAKYLIMDYIQAVVFPQIGIDVNEV